MSRKSFALTCFLFVVGLYLSACGGSGGSGGGSQSPSVSVTASGTTVDANDVVTLTATVTNDKNAAGVTWSVSGGGALSNTTTSSATYTAPAPASTALTVTVTATSVADATKSGTATITVPAKPAITTGALTAGTVGSAYSATIAGSGGIGPYIWSISSGTLPAGLTMNSAGVISGTPTAVAVGTTNLTFVLTDSGKATALTATVTLGLTINAAPAITFTGTMPATAIYESSAPYVGLATATGGAGSLTYSVAGGSLPPGLVLLSTANGEISGTPSSVGTFNFTMKAADAFGDSATQGYTITVNLATPTLAFAAIPTHTYGDAPFAVSATSASSGAVTYSVTSGPATIAGNTVTLTGAGTVVLGASQAATTTYTAATASISFTVNSETPTLTFASIPSHTFGDAPFTVSATSASSGTVTYSVTSGPATIAGNTVTLTGGGTVVLGASQAADGNYGTATASTSFTVNPATPTLAFAAIPNHAYGDAPFAVSATSASSGAFTYSVTSGLATVAGNTVTLTGVGTVVLGASQAATANFNSATASTSFTVGAGTPTLTFAAIPTHTFGDAPFTVSATSASTGTVTYSVTSGPATIAGDTVTITGAGTVVLGASQAATSNYSSATASTSFTVNPATPTLTFAAIPTHIFGDAPFTVSATSASTGAVTYSVTSGPANVAGNTVTLTGAGTVVLGASQSATADYTAATASTSFTVNPALSVASATTLAPATVNIFYSQPLAASGGSGTYTNWTVTAGGSQLAAINLSLSTGGVLSGTPLAGGTANFTVQVTDSQSHTATANLTVTAYSTLTVTSTSLPGANLGASYSQSLVAAGGTGTNFSWTASSSNLAAYGLSLSTAGVVSGTPTQTGTATFTANVTDSGSNTAQATVSITIYGALSLPAPNPSSLPSTGYTNVAYTGTIGASGGSGNYSWQVTGLSDNLNSSPAGGTLTIAGTPGATPATVSFNVTLTDMTTNASVTQNGYSIVIGNPTPVTLPTPSSTVPGSATQNQSYNGAITASGGVPPYTWSINGTAVTASGLALANSLTATSSGGSSLSIAGTPISTTTVNLNNVTVTDKLGSTQTNSYSIAVNGTGSSLSGQIFLNNNCGSSGSQPTFTVTIDTTPTATTTTTDGNGNYSFTGIPDGTYTVTPSIAGASSSLFSPTSYAFVTLNKTSNNNVTGENFNAVVGYTVSGTVSYTAAATPQTGQTYLVLSSNNCGSYGAPGTSITNATLTSGGAFTIQGVPPGSYTLKAWMDPIGQGLPNAIDPAGSSPVTVSSANVTNAAVTMTDPTYATPSSNPTISGITPNPQGVLIQFSPSTNTSGVEDATEYLVQWSTSPTLVGGSNDAQLLCAESGNVCPNHIFQANGDNGVWILTNAVAGGSPFVSGQTYYFQARAFNPLNTANPNPAGWTNYTAGVTIGTPSCTGTCTSVSGAVTIPSSITIQAGASLYLGLIQMDPNTGNPAGIYATVMTTPVTGANNYLISVPSGSNYAVFGILDQKNGGEIGPGVIANVRNDFTANTTISGASMTGQDATLPTVGALVDVQTNYYQTTTSSGSSTGYQINLQVSESNKLPVAVTLSSGPNLPNNSGTVALDLSSCTDCGNPKFNYSANFPGGTPAVNDTYGFTVTYNDGSQDTGSVINGKVTAFGNTGAVVGPSDLATNLSPSANLSTSLTPTFTWTFPANPGSYYYSGYIAPSNCSGPCTNVWQIPGKNSQSKGFTYAQTGSGTNGSLTWGIDPIIGDNSTPTGNLVPNTIYNWQIQGQDDNGNKAQATTWYQP